MEKKNFSKKAVMAALESKGFSVSVGSDDCEENIHLNITKDENTAELNIHLYDGECCGWLLESAGFECFKSSNGEYLADNIDFAWIYVKRCGELNIGKVVLRPSDEFEFGWDKSYNTSVKMSAIYKMRMLLSSGVFSKYNFEVIDSSDSLFYFYVNAQTEQASNLVEIINFENELDDFKHVPFKFEKVGDSNTHVLFKISLKKDSNNN